jgi:hypothetical protein
MYDSEFMILRQEFIRVTDIFFAEKHPISKQGRLYTGCQPILHRTVSRYRYIADQNVDGLQSTFTVMSTKKLQLSSFSAGDTVLTSYGAGVIVEVVPTDGLLSSDNVYSVRLWRIPNRSIGSSSLARLQSSAVRLIFQQHDPAACLSLIAIV